MSGVNALAVIRRDATDADSFRADHAHADDRAKFDRESDEAIAAIEQVIRWAKVAIEYGATWEDLAVRNQLRAALASVDGTAVKEPGHE